MKNVLFYVKEVGLYLNLILVVSLISILLNDLIWNDLPELFNGANELLSAYYNFCISIVGSYIFYFIVVHMKEMKDKKNVNQHIGAQSKKLLFEYDCAFAALKMQAGRKSEDRYASKDEIKKILLNVNPHSDAPMGNGHIYVNWYTFLTFYIERSQSNITKIFEKMPFLDSEHVKILAAIDSCSYFMSLNAAKELQFGNTDMSVWADHFYNYACLCKELEEYNKRFN
ncbi:TPA: hypothetical protein ACX6QF_001162 [Photobacterium damselae]